MSKPINTVAIVAYRDPDIRHVATVLNLCREAGISCQVGLQEAQNPDLVLILGGDGSVLQYLHDVHFRGMLHILQVPVLHVGTGKVNFFSDVTITELSLDVFQKLKEGQYTIDQRVLLEVEVNDQKIPVLNEVLVRYVNPGKLTSFTICEIEGEVIMSGRMDGVIIATPTGSTAYILALGGPVVDFRIRNVKIIIPVAPFTPAFIPVVHPVEIPVEVKADGVCNVVCDGIMYATAQRIIVRKSDMTFKFVRTRPYNFYRKLTQRLFTP